MIQYVIHGQQFFAGVIYTIFEGQLMAFAYFSVMFIVYHLMLMQAFMIWRI